MTRAGIVAVVGKPNAGKSTLLNRLVGQKLSITSAKPQSTRDRIVGIRTEDGVQMVLLDTPGLLDPKYALQQAMHATARVALEDADVIVHVADATAGVPESLEVVARLPRAPRAPVLLALNKIDAVVKAEIARLRAEVPDALQVSAANGAGMEALLAAIAGRLPESPYLYPEDELSTQSMRFFAAELVRETALEQLSDEIPYAVACEIEEFREDRSPVYIRAVMHVERDSQKRILIGSGGARIKTIGRGARVKIERLVGGPVYLDLWVKVLPNWRRSPQALARFGFSLPKEGS